MTITDPVTKAGILIEALPYMRMFEGKTFVIKYGGHAMVDDNLKHTFAKNVILLRQLGVNPVVVHGGGPQIGAALKRMGVTSTFIDGMRVTDQDTVNVVEMVLAGAVNKDIVNLINLNGGKAAGLSGKDGHTIQAKKLTHVKVGADAGAVVDLGWVGTVERIDTGLLELFDRSDIIPVIAPVGVGSAGETYNINADLVAGHLAMALKAEKLILLTDVPGVKDGSGNLLSRLKRSEIDAMIADGTITGGMLPKVNTCVQAVSGGVTSAHIIDGRVEHSLLLEIFTDEGIGTIIDQRGLLG